MLTFASAVSRTVVMNEVLLVLYQKNIKYALQYEITSQFLSCHAH